MFQKGLSFRKNIQTHTTLYSSLPIEADKKIAAVESLFKIYGKDIYSSGELEFHERDILETGSFWTGRTWRFNEQHAVLSTESENEKTSYEVRVDDMEDEEGFKVSIFSYNELVSLFGIS